MKTTRIVFCLLLMLVLAVPAWATPPGPDASDHQTELDLVVGAIQKQIADINGRMSTAAATLCEAGLESQHCMKVLGGLYEGEPYVLSVVTLDQENTIISVLPKDFDAAIGKKTGNPGQADTVRETGMPLLSKHFTMAEGFVANALNYPVNCNGKYWGIVSITFNLADFVVDAMPPEYGSNVFILRADDGFFVYSNRQENNYRSVLKDPKFKKLYPQFAELGRQILAAPMGEGNYKYKNAAGKMASKSCIWQTVDFAGQQWRVVYFWED